MVPARLAMVIFFAVSAGPLLGSAWLCGEVFIRLVSKRLGAKRARNYSAEVEGPYLTLPAVANVIAMRDTLAEVDAERE